MPRDRQAPTYRPRYIAPAPQPEPKPLEALTRPQIAARVFTLRGALDSLADQSDRDGGAVATCTGAMKKCLIELEARLRELDRQAPERPLASAVTVPAAEQRLRQAGADLAEVVREIAVDRARAMANTAARHRAQALEETARILELAELNRIPMDEIAALAPSLARELQAERGVEA